MTHRSASVVSTCTATPPWYVGRLSVDDEERTPLVVDWRAPIAEPFYRATAVEPMGVVRRRHFITRGGREITHLDDEVFDHDATRTAGYAVAGEGALLLALERHRTGRMGDIVATIQAEQDEAIRADLPGILVVSGGPGTGKTAVALHRAAYLLYTYRRRLSSSGVLLVGPSPVFLRYIEQVLPSLGEQDVQLSTVAGLKPGLRFRSTESFEAAAVKGSARMAGVIAKAVADRQRALPREIAVPIDGMAPRITREATARIVQAARRRHGTHNERRPYVVRRLLDHLVGELERAAVHAYESDRLDRRGPDPRSGATAWRQEGPSPLVASALARGERPPDDFIADLRSRLRSRPEVREALERMWPVLTGAELMRDLLGFPALLRSAAAGALDDAEIRLLYRPRTGDLASAPWTEADVGLIDEADSLLGPAEDALPRRRRRTGPDDESVDFAERVVDELGLGSHTTAALLAERFDDSDSGAHDSEPRTFGHVMVDEAQDLTAMQWRMLARRCPSGSMTLVGDPGQASRPGAVASWESVLAHLPSHHVPRFAVLSMNYRTPAEIMGVATRLLAVAAPTVEPSTSVRATGRTPRFVSYEEPAFAHTVADATRGVLHEGGTVAVIAPAEMHAEVVGALTDLGATADLPEALDAPVSVLDATTAKGLEFDHVVVVEPSRLVTPDAPGLRLLYVTLTRATTSLTVLHGDPLPEALDSP
ncbi:MAG: AAA family ATPase [Acidimicrobiia bacterium]|nr:AAA family ATPase [Acidimicrobiia bacterium]